VHLVRHLEECGDDVVQLERMYDGIDIIDAREITEAVVAAKPEAVYHLAGAADVGGSWTLPEETVLANALGTLNVLEASRQAGADRVLAISSADVYGRVTEDELPIHEDQPLRPVSPYAASKVAADALAQQAWLGHRFPAIRVRAFNHLGPGQSDRFVAPSLAARIARNERDGGDEVPIGNTTPLRDVTDVRDVVRAYRLLVERGEPGGVYNVCSGRAVAVKEIADMLLGMAERPMRLVSDPELQRPVDIPVLVGDNAKLRAATGWSPTIPIEQTLADVLADWRARIAG
jgi:GDP-4-dehydro-6-deoxy-D-mannose reductase